MYSGVFEVRNISRVKIHNVEFSDFGAACPGGKINSPGGWSISTFPPLDRLPESTTVTWIEEGTESQQAERIEVASKIPTGRNGSIVFWFEEDLSWRVTFELKERWVLRRSRRAGSRLPPRDESRFNWNGWATIAIL